MTEQLVIRNLPEGTKAALRRKGAPAETVGRELLIASVAPTEDPVLGWLAAAAALPPVPSSLRRHEALLATWATSSNDRP